MNFSEISPVITEFLSGKGIDSQCDIELAGSAGSQRVYYRLKKKTVTFIVMLSPAHDNDFGRFLRLTQFYRLVGFPVPKVFCIDDDKRQVLLEDLGAERFYDSIINGANRVEMYKKAIDVLIFLQSSCFQRHMECPDIFSRVFDTRDLLWESNYFLREYITGFLGRELPKHESSLLGYEFQVLADKVNSQPRTIMHRDFQSQNIMNQGGHLRIIDYQGSRLGSVYYDLASLLLDPYVMLEEKDIEVLFFYYHSKTLSELSPDEALYQFYLAGVQRIMQALGAYCYLSCKKKIKSFSQYIQPGQKRFRWVLENAGLIKLQKAAQRMSET